jgi:hypothetical protein
MNNDLKELIEIKFGSAEGSDNQLKVICPFCDHHKKKLEINIDKQIYHCWICDKSGQLFNLFKQFNVDTSLLKQEKIISTDKLDEVISELTSVEPDKILITTKIPDEYKPLREFNKSNNYKIAINYLLNIRKLKIYDIIKYNIYYDTKYYNILIPSYNDTGNINYCFVRSINSTYKQNSKISRKDIIFNELFIDWSEPITLVEGPFDAISAGNNSVPLLGSTLNNDYELFKRLIEHKPTIYLALDHDAKLKQSKIAELLYSHGLNIYCISMPKDKDINEMGYSEFIKYKKNATVYTEMSKLLNILEDL